MAAIVRKSAIYALKDSEGAIRYVGRAYNPRIRLQDHCRPARFNCSLVANWSRKLQAAGAKPLLEVLEWTDDWDARERHWIALLRSEGVDLLNVTAGGYDMEHVTSPVIPSPSYRWAMRLASRRRNKKLAQILRLRMNEARVIGKDAILALEAVFRAAILEAAPLTKLQ